MDIYNNSYYRFTKGQKREAVLANTMIRKFNANDWRLKYLYKHVDSSFTNFGIHVQNPQYTIDVSGNINNTLDYYHNGYLLMPVGMITPFAGSSAPSGWFICDGDAVSRSTYNKLFAVISTTYGTGNGTTTFNLPNLTGRVPFGHTGSGSFSTVGGTGGSATKTLSISEMPAHTHSGTTDSNGSHTHTHNANGGSSNGSTGLAGLGTVNTPGSVDNDGGAEINVNNTYALTINSSGSHTHTFTTGSTGSGSSFSILPPYMVLHYIIRHGRNDHEES